jgi:hypothetical protein
MNWLQTIEVSWVRQTEGNRHELEEVIDHVGQRILA